MNWYRIAAPVNPMAKTLAPIEMQALVNSVISQLLSQPKNPSYLAGRQQITQALENTLKQRGAILQNSNAAVDEIMRALGYQMPAKNQPAAPKMGPQGWEDPGMAALRQQRQQQPAAPKAPIAPAAPQRKNPFAF